MSECELPVPVSRVYKEELDIILPYRAKDGRRIMICCVGKWNPSKASIHELLLTFYALLEVIALEPKTQVGGKFIGIKSKVQRTAIVLLEVVEVAKS